MSAAPRLPPAAAQKIADGQAALNAALMNEDPLGMVIRAHIHIEKLLIDFLEVRMPKTALAVLKLDFDRRVHLAIAFGLPTEFKAALHFVGSLRNRFAHQLDAALTKEDAKNFARALGPENREISRQSYLLTHRRLASAKQPADMKALPPRDQVMLHLVTLWTGVALIAAYAAVAAGETHADVPH